AHEHDPGARRAHRALAREVTTLVHGAAAADAAEGASTILFGGDPTEASAEALATVAAEVPTLSLDGSDLPPLSVALREAGVARSSSDARNALAQGGVYVNGVRQADDRPLAAADLLHGRYALLRKGK